MKEANAELNLTVFIVIAVGVLIAFFYTVVWPMIGASQNRTANCNKAICNKNTYSEGTVRCVVYENDGITVKIDNITCPWKG